MLNFFKRYQINPDFERKVKVYDIGNKKPLQKTDECPFRYAGKFKHYSTTDRVVIEDYDGCLHYENIVAVKFVK